MEGKTFIEVLMLLAGKIQRSHWRRNGPEELIIANLVFMSLMRCLWINCGRLRTYGEGQLGICGCVILSLVFLRPVHGFLLQEPLIKERCNILLNLIKKCEKYLEAFEVDNLSRPDDVLNEWENIYINEPAITIYLFHLQLFSQMATLVVPLVGYVRQILSLLWCIWQKK